MNLGLGGRLTNMHSEYIDASSFNFIKPITIKELGFSNKRNIQIPIIVNSSNFDFNTLRTDGGDIRFAETISGQRGLFYWISDFDFTNKKALIWLQIPKLNINESKTIYMFFGKSSLTTTSNLNNLSFNFKYRFDHTPISSYLFYGTLNRGINEHGFSLGANNLKFTITHPPFRGKNRWEVFTNLYYSSSINNISFDFTGEENDINFTFTGQNSISTNIRTGSNQSRSDAHIGCEPNSSNLIYFSYDERIDYFFYRSYFRNSFIDYSLEMERGVEGNTTLNTLSVNGIGNSDARIKYLLIREHIRDEVSVDLSELFPTIYDYYNSVYVDTEQYTDNITTVEYHHESNAGGPAVNLSNNLYDEHNTYWGSSDDVSNCNVFIDFGRDSNNLVGTNYRHISSGSIGNYTAHRLSNHSVGMEVDHWKGRHTAGIACIDFESNPKQVNCLILEGYDDNGMVRRFRFKGSYKSPTVNFSDWQVLYDGVCAKSAEKQYFYFKNFGKYRYYMLEVLSTYGNNIKLKSWWMYKMPNVSFFNGVFVDRVSIRPSLYGSNVYNFPRYISMDATNDYKDWFPLLEETHTYSPFSESLYGYWQHFKFINNNKFRVYRLKMRDTWGGDDRFVLEEWQLTRSYKEHWNNRILTTTDDTFFNVLADKATGFDGGWVYGINRDELFFIYDDYLARKQNVTKGFDLGSTYIDLTK